MHLPTMIECYSSPRDMLNYAYKILVQMNRQHLTNPDEVELALRQTLSFSDPFIRIIDLFSCDYSTMRFV